MSHLIPQDLPAWIKFLLAFSLFAVRYIIFAGSAFLVFYVIKRQDWIHMKIQQKFPERKRILHEIFYSFLTFAIFGLMVLLIGIMRNHGLTWKYGDLSSRPIWYFVFSSVFIIFFHDFYFYFTHRLMHHKLIFKHVHKVHHMSNDPTPWAAFSFHPTEAVIEFAFVPLLAVAMPIHPLSFLILSMWMIMFNVLGHLGFEVFPKYFTRHWFFKWNNTATHHNMHHKFVTCNYGLYFNIWDTIMGTNHAKYLETFDKVTARRDAASEQKAQQEQQHDEELQLKPQI